MENIIEVRNLTKYYGKTLGVENLSLELKQGEIFGFIGPNGAGKSTTIRSILNLINKTKGEVKIFGKTFTRDNLELKKLIGYLPSEVYLYEELTVKEILDFHESFYDEYLKERRKNLVSLLQIDEKKKVEDLSLGNKKKVGIVLSLLHNPKILILDEPTSGLDPIMQQVFYKLLLEEKKKGTTIIYSTHILSEVSKICDRVGIIKEGHLLKIETINSLLKKSLTYITIESDEIDKIEKELKLEVVSKKENEIKLKNTINPNELIKSLSKFKIDKLLIEEATLEEMLLHYYE